jgi:histidinol-phosphatase (PHP family)
MTADYHLHTPLCHHAVGEPADYARAAVAAGLPEIGMADHSPMPEPFDDWRMARQDLPRYLDLVQAARAAVPGMPVRLGLEVDFFDDGLGWIEELAGFAPWDYLIGSVHYIGRGGARWGVDHPDAKARYVATPGATEAVWEDYWKTYTAMARAGLFDLLAHPDLPKKFGFRPPGDLERFYRPAIEAAADAGVAIELNTAGWHKEASEQYPARRFLELMREAGVPLAVSSDAHQPDHVGRDFARAVALAKEMGFTHTVRFEGRRRTLAPLP